MLKNYFKIAWRNLVKNRIDSIISIGGLALGITCCLLLISFVQFEWSFDQFHENSDRTFLLYTEYENPNDEIRTRSATPFPLTTALRDNIPGLEEAVRFRGTSAEVKIDGQYFFEPTIVRAGSGFFRMFSFPFVAGNPETALEKPNNIVLTREKAQQIFGTTQVIGEVLPLRAGGTEVSFTVSGVLQDIPDNSSIAFEYLVPFENGLMQTRGRDNWSGSDAETYLMFDENVSMAKVKENLEGYIREEAPSPFLERNELHLLPLQEIYLSPELADQPRKSSNPLFGWILASISLVVLAIAAMNFMSLSLSRAARRSHEISIRKVNGAGRLDLRIQFLGEALLTCSLAFVLGGLLAEMAMPWFRNLVNKPVSLDLLSSPAIWGGVLGLLIMATLITGGYPAWMMARKKITSGFTSRTTSGKIPVMVKGMIVVQFTLAIAFLSAAFIMSSQMNFISNKDLGFNPDNLVDIEMSLTDPEKGDKIYREFSRKAAKLAGVRSETPLFGMFGNPSIRLVADSLRATAYVEIIDEHFIETMQADIVAGRGFSEERTSEFENAILLNREAAEMFGWENPVGKTIPQTKHKSFLDGKKIIGVVENYHYRPLYYPMNPLIFVHREVQDFGTMTMRVRIADGKMTGTLRKLENVWNEMYPHQPFKYSHVSNLVAQQYEDQRRWMDIIHYASSFAILISCFGLFGLASLAARRRLKEISIRKVLGATVTNILSLLSKDFVKLVMVAFMLAIPIAWYVMNQWLSNFAYHIELGPGIFVLAGALALLISLATVSWQSIRAATVNPVENLRNE